MFGSICADSELVSIILHSTDFENGKIKRVYFTLKTQTKMNFIIIHLRFLININVHLYKDTFVQRYI